MMRFLQSKWVSVGLLIGISWLGVSAYHARQDKQKTAQQVSNVNTKISTLEKDNTMAQQVLEYLKNPEYLAKEVRLKLNFKAADEQVAYVYQEEKNPAAASVVTDDHPTSLLAKIKNWLYNLVH